MAYYSLNGKSVTSFPRDSKRERAIDFLRKVSKENRGKGILIVLDNFKSHKAEAVTKEAERLRMGLIFLPSYSFRPESDRIRLEEHQRGHLSNVYKAIDDMQNVIKEAFCRLSRMISFATGWGDILLTKSEN